MRPCNYDRAIYEELFVIHVGSYIATFKSIATHNFLVSLLCRNVVSYFEVLLVLSYSMLLVSACHLFCDIALRK